VAIVISFFPEQHGLGFLWIVPGSLAAGIAAGMLTVQLTAVRGRKLGASDACSAEGESAAAFQLTPDNRTL
jgi:hypothetical protein